MCSCVQPTRSAKAMRSVHGTLFCMPTSAPIKTLFLDILFCNLINLKALGNVYVSLFRNNQKKNNNVSTQTQIHIHIYKYSFWVHALIHYSKNVNVIVKKKEKRIFFFFTFYNFLYKNQTNIPPKFKVS